MSGSDVVESAKKRSGEMLRRLVVALYAIALLVSSGMAYSEMEYAKLTVGDVSSSVTFRSGTSVMICNSGQKTAYFRLFYGDEVAAPASTSNAPAFPGCYSFGKPSRSSSGYSAVSAVCASGETTTLHIYID